MGVVGSDPERTSEGVLVVVDMIEVAIEAAEREGSEDPQAQAEAVATLSEETTVIMAVEEMIEVVPHQVAMVGTEMLAAAVETITIEEDDKQQLTKDVIN